MTKTAVGPGLGVGLSGPTGRGEVSYKYESLRQILTYQRDNETRDVDRPVCETSRDRHGSHSGLSNLHLTRDTVSSTPPLPLSCQLVPFRKNE